MKTTLRNALLAVLLLLSGSDAFSTLSSSPSSSPPFWSTTTTTTTTTTPQHTQLPEQSRSDFLTHLASIGFVATTATLLNPAAAAAASASTFANTDTTTTVKGTKKDPAYEACISKCMYECTKPKGQEQKSRAECLPDCKKQCATTKEQLLMGTPKPAAV